MQPADFSDSKPGRLIQGPGGVWTFAPAPLPPELLPSWPLAQALSSADRRLSELAGAARMLPNPHLMIQPFVRREAVLSSRIEGTRASLSDLLLYEAGQRHLFGSDAAEPRPSDVHEVNNYVQALDYGMKRLKQLPVSVRLIKELHERLMKGVRGERMTPGEFRRTQNWIGPPGCTLADATYVPPPPGEMDRALSELEKYLNPPPQTQPVHPPLIRFAMMHYQFEAIHPFLDGNGRIGRLLITLLLCAENLLPHPLLYLSAYFERTREQYYRRLLRVSLHGEWNEWLIYFLDGVSQQAEDALHRSRRLLDLWNGYRAKLQSEKASGVALQLVDELFAMPMITVSHAGKRLKVTPRAAQLNINKLIAAGMLKEITGRKRYRVYHAPEIFNILNAATS